MGEVDTVARVGGIQLAAQQGGGQEVTPAETAAAKEERQSGV